MQVDEVQWRVKIRNLKSVNFDDKKKQLFLESLQKHGKVTLACQASGILYTTYRDGVANDEDFNDAVEHTVKLFNDRRVHILESAAMKGNTEPIFGPNGETGERTRYESGLRAMVLKAYAPDLYGDKAIEVNHNLGAVIVPAVLNDVEWEAQFVEQQGKFEALTVDGEEAPMLTEGAESDISEREARQADSSRV